MPYDVVIEYNIVVHYTRHILYRLCTHFSRYLRNTNILMQGSRSESLIPILVCLDCALPKYWQRQVSIWFVSKCIAKHLAILFYSVCLVKILP
jgi:hypothetical protein